MSTTTTTTHDTFTTGGRHPVNVGHLVMGIAFLGLVGIWALVQSDVVGGDDVRWLLPVPWVLAGLAGLLATTLSSRGKYETRVTGWVPATGTAHPGENAEAADATDATDATDDTDGTATAPVDTATDPDDRA